MSEGIYYSYHGFGLKAFEGRHIRIRYTVTLLVLSTLFALGEVHNVHMNKSFYQLFTT
jgi:hypothetical protein